MRKFKAELTIPTEQFGNIRPTVEGTAEEIVEAYFEFSRMVKPKQGIPDKDYNAFMDSYLMGNLEGLGEVYQVMSPEQQHCVQTIKRSLARIKRRQNGKEKDENLSASDGPKNQAEIN